MPLERVSGTGVAVDEITTLEGLEGLRCEWQRLWDGCATVTPFQSPEWCIALWRALGSGALRVLAFRVEGRLVGLAPLWCGVDARGASTFRLIGEPVSDYLDLLAAPGFERSVPAALFEYLALEDDCELGCEFQQLRADSLLLRAESPEGWRDEVSPDEVCPVVEWGRARNGNEARISPHFRKRLSYDRGRLERAGEVTLEIGRPETLPELLAGWARLHQARWKQRGEAGVLGDDAVRRFHLEAAPALAARGVLRFYALRLAGQVIACYYGFVYRRRAYYYLGGFDPEFERRGVGHQLVWHAIEAARREGAHTFDFLRGQEAYKYRWGARDQPTFRRRLTWSGGERRRAFRGERHESRPVTPSTRTTGGHHDCIHD